MSEEKNIPEENNKEEIPILKQNDVSENISPPEDIASTKPETENAKLETENMEVHHHTHADHGKKSWKAYFWEFLMLFLAVFCGFLAENEREHLVDHEKEKQYAATLLEDLVNDTATLNSNIFLWKKVVIANVDTVRGEIEKEPAARDPLLLYRCAARLVTNSNFYYHDRTISQLKNSGNFRLLQKDIADSLIDYDSRIISGLKDIEERYNITYFQNREVLQEQLFNTKLYPLRFDPEKLAAAAKKEPAVLEIRKGKEDILFQYYNSLYSLQFQTSIRVREEKRLVDLATNIILMLKKDYHLINE
jgi:hypothetical protein